MPNLLLLLTMKLKDKKKIQNDHKDIIHILYLYERKKILQPTNKKKKQVKSIGTI